MRIHHFSHADLGITLGSIVIICGCTGVYTSGHLIDILSARGIWYAPQLVAALAALCATAPLVISVTTSNTYLAVAAFAVAFYFASFPMPPQLLFYKLPYQPLCVHVFLRPCCFVMLSGLSGGSLLIGTLNDHFFHSPLAIGTSMAIVSGTASFLGALLLFASIPSYKLLCSTANTKVSYTSDLPTNSMKTSRI